MENIEKYAHKVEKEYGTTKEKVEHENMLVIINITVKNRADFLFVKNLFKIK